MARVRIKFYKNSFLASLISIFGSMMIALGICLLFEDLTAGIIFVVSGAVFSLWASAISERKRFKLWIKDLKKKGAIEQLSSSRELCWQMYQANPNKRTIKFIAKHNPVVAEEILSSLKK